MDTSRDTLTAERANAQLAGLRLNATVQLIKALGGGWSNREIVGAPINSQLVVSDKK